MLSSLGIPHPNSWHLWLGKYRRIPLVFTLPPLKSTDKVDLERAQKLLGTACARTFGYYLPHCRVFGPNLCTYRFGRGAPHPSTGALRLTPGGPGAALPGHGAVLLVFVRAHTQEGAFHVFTEGFATHATEQLTFVHIWKREHRPSQTGASLLCLTSCAKGWHWLETRTPSEQGTPAAPQNRAVPFGLYERAMKMQSEASKFQFRLSETPQKCTASIRSTFDALVFSSLTY